MSQDHQKTIKENKDNDMKYFKDINKDIIYNEDVEIEELEYFTERNDNSET